MAETQLSASRRNQAEGRNGIDGRCAEKTTLDSVHGAHSMKPAQSGNMAAWKNSNSGDVADRGQVSATSMREVSVGALVKFQ